ncbi:NERD domain-containing protein [Microcystis sp. BLCC-F210]|uniref:NERD domain-containing protein n=1 Tax=Microcystis sp. BLCC-F210 TaxID=3342751 RepID=UPI0035C8DCFF
MTTTADDVWRLLAELVEAQKETERCFQETERRFQETERRFQETERILKEQSLKTDRQITRLSKEIGNLGGKWGRFVENMVAPACETLFLNRHIPVHQVSQRVRKRLDGKTLEIDVLVTNENHVLVVEVKSSLSVDDVKELIKNLTEFRQFFPEYNHKELYGAVAGIEIEEGADKYAYRQGLFVLAQKGENVAILNDTEFQPQTW